MSGAKNRTPQEVVQDLCETLKAKRDGINAQMQALHSVAVQPGSTLSAELVLALYLSLSSGKHVAEFVNGQGWRVPGAKGQPRELACADVFAVIRGEPCAVPPCGTPVLLDMARHKLLASGGSKFAMSNARR